MKQELEAAKLKMKVENPTEEVNGLCAFLLLAKPELQTFCSCYEPFITALMLNIVVAFSGS